MTKKWRRVYAWVLTAGLRVRITSKQGKDHEKDA